MIVFKTFLKILNKNKGLVIFYTLLLVGISYFNMQNNETSLTFEQVKPDVFIVDNDDSSLSHNLVTYLKDNMNVIKDLNTEEKINDAIFYRDINYYIEIPKNYFEDLLNNQDKGIIVKTTNDYQARFAEKILDRYIRLVSFYKDKTENNEELINLVNNNLKNQVEVQLTTKLDTTSLTKMATYFNFSNYSIIASLVFIITLILNVFNDKKISNRITVSSMNYKYHNRLLLYSNLLLSLFLFIIYVLFSFFIVGSGMFSINGLICILNMFLFIICSTTFAILLGNLINNKNAIGGVINVIALGTSFLCGSFVPMSYLPDTVIKIGQIFPSYYYIKTNEISSTLEEVNIDTLKPIITNSIIILLFTIFFIILTNIVIKRKRVN